MQTKVLLPLQNKLSLIPIQRQISPLQTHPASLFKIYFNIIFPSTPRSYKWSLSFTILYQNFVYISNIQHICNIFDFLILPGFINRKLLDEIYKYWSFLFSNFV